MDETPNPPNLKASALESTLPNTSASETLALESLCRNAWPPLEEQSLGGWTLRFGKGYTRRANSVQPLALPQDEPARALDTCERLYAERGLPCVFKITPVIKPPALLELLNARDYTTEGHTSVQEGPVLPPTLSERGSAHTVQIMPATHPDWLAAFFRLDTTPEPDHPAMAEILGRIPRAPGVTNTGALIAHQGRVICCGRAVAEKGRVGLFDLVTDPAQRGQGMATALIGALLGWGRAHGAQGAYLQVEVNNAPALRLYHALGFRERYCYHYRVQPSS